MLQVSGLTITLPLKHQFGPSTIVQSCTTVDPTHGSGRVGSTWLKMVKYYVEVIHCTAFTVQFPTHAYEVQRSEDIAIRCTPGDKMVRFYCVVHLL